MLSGRQAKSLFMENNNNFVGSGQSDSSLGTDMAVLAESLDLDFPLTTLLLMALFRDP